jgi:hypothetical protein
MAGRGKGKERNERLNTSSTILKRDKVKEVGKT